MIFGLVTKKDIQLINIELDSLRNNINLIHSDIDMIKKKLAKGGVKK